jgi:hypothetical protein
MTTDRNAQILTQAVVLHGYNIFLAALLAAAASPIWAVPQTVMGVGALMYGGSKK